MDNDKKFKCECCKYNTNKPSDWLKHINCEKHKRNGVNKKIECIICNYRSTSHWNLKIHNLSYHSSNEDKIKHKYYCKLCDFVMFNSNYYNRHFTGNRHKKNITLLNNI
jgi:hypothetical protein